MPADDLKAVVAGGAPIEIVKQVIKDSKGKNVQGFDGSNATVTAQITFLPGCPPQLINAKVYNLDGRSVNFSLIFIQRGRGARIAFTSFRIWHLPRI